MIVKSIIKRYLVFIAGLYLLAMGIVLIVRSSLGTTPISSINYVLSLHSPLSLGTWTFIINLLLIAGQFFLVRKKKNRKDIVDILLQLPFSLVFSAFIDFNMAIMGNLHPSGYGMSVVLLLVGCIVQSIGVVFEIKPKVTMMSAEAFVKHASCHCNKDFGKFKVCFDVTLVMLAVMISLIFTRRIEGVREGSLIAACITGYIINFLNHRIMTRRMLYKLLPVLKKNR
ncbi:hypothetical protein FQ707_00210 [Bacteroidaceae bacterium HV4-6-C5C]|nr:hypothetical protein FQ707_00210 [Bacteroidaceae bacterium HV4-6-C5C]